MNSESQPIASEVCTPEQADEVCPDCRCESHDQSSEKESDDQDFEGTEEEKVIDDLRDQLSAFRKDFYQSLKLYTPDIIGQVLEVIFQFFDWASNAAYGVEYALTNELDSKIFNLQTRLEFYGVDCEMNKFREIMVNLIEILPSDQEVAEEDEENFHKFVSIFGGSK